MFPFHAVRSDATIDDLNKLSFSAVHFSAGLMNVLRCTVLYAVRGYDTKHVTV